jgi:hypothetical protein
MEPKDAAMVTQTEAMAEARAQMLDELRNGYAPRASPMTAEELAQASADRKAGRIGGMTPEEAKAAADAFCGLAAGRGRQGIRMGAAAHAGPCEKDRRDHCRDRA